MVMHSATSGLCLKDVHGSTRVLCGLQRDLKYACAWACCLANRAPCGLWLTKCLFPTSGRSGAGRNLAVQATKWCPGCCSLAFSKAWGRKGMN